MTEPLHVLLIEDSEGDAALTLRVLTNAGYDVHSQRVENAEAMRSALARELWDIVIADYRLPQFDAPAALAVLHETELDIPFIVVSATIGEDIAVAMMKSGAHDYVLKGNLARLAPAVEREIREARSRRDRRTLEGQLRQAQKLESIGRLAGGVAHDFNNALTVIIGYSQMMLGELAPEHPFRDPIEEISRTAMHAAGLIRQLLTFSRGHVNEPRTVFVNKLIEDFRKMLGRLISEQIELVLSLDPGVRAIRADPGQLEQVMMNLALNARDAMPDGGTLSIATSNFEVDEHFTQTHLWVAPGSYVLLSVSDTGVGMSSEVQAHVFEPFFTTKEPGRGTGLGLSTVYGIVKQNRGSIWVTTEPGCGSTFGMLFPVAEPGPEPAEATPIQAASSGRETILLAEDEPAVRKYAREILRAHGYTVLETSNGREAVELARQYGGAIHLLLADAVMPELCGSELEARFSAVRPGIAVLCMSGYSDEVSTAAPIGPNHITKPFTPAALLHRIRTLLDAG